MVHSARKTQKKRGSRTHGYGNAQKHRGAGSRGGRGMAGSKKHKWMKVSKECPGYFGSKGFTRPVQAVKKINAINVGRLQSDAERLVSEGKAEKKGDVYIIDLSKLGYDKLLGSGSVSEKFEISVDVATEGARKKIEQSGGAITETKPGQPVKEVVDESGVSETGAEVSA